MARRDGIDWTVVMPVKVLAVAKSRLASATAPGELAFAFFADTMDAVVATTDVAEVIVATSDARVRDHAISVGCAVVGDAAHPGINAAVASAAVARAGTGGTAVIVSDLPCLTPDALHSVLQVASRYPTSFLADADGTGTAMWFTSSGSTVTSRFGPQSRAAHVGAQHADLVSLHPREADVWVVARRDVDTAEALDEAIGLGIGPRSRAALAEAAPDAIIVTVVDRVGADLVVVDEGGAVSRLPWRIAIDAGFADLHPGQRLALARDVAGTPTVTLP